MGTFSRKDGLFAALAAAILLIGTATGSAIAMFVISAIALALMVVFYRRRPRSGALLSGALLAALVAAVIAIVIGMVLTLR